MIFAITCSFLLQGSRTVQTHEFQLSQFEAIKLANTLGVRDPLKPDFKRAVCEHMSYAIELTESEFDGGDL